MSNVHGKRTVVIVDGTELTTYCDNSNVERAATIHGVTTYGTDDELNEGGLRKGTVTMSGMYDSSETAGPRPALIGKEGTTVPFIRRLEGTGTGLPEESMDIVIEKVAFSAPVADFIKWTMDATRTGAILDSTQA